MLMMALAMPGAASALGLGDIHVDSALNERLAAEIDLVGATPEDLIDLRAAVANRDTFLRYGAERPAFLASATFKVATDSQGHPVLAIRSTDAFTEPLVNFLVDLRWHKGEIVREYTLLLDPPNFGSASRLAALPAATSAPDVPAAPPAAQPLAGTRIQTTSRPVGQTRDPSGDQPARQIKVGANATLRGIAWRLGARSEADLKKMMMAIFRANPGAFDGNINRLHLGAVLDIPSDAALAAMSTTDAKREFHAQMMAWHAPLKRFAANNDVPAAPFANAPVPEIYGASTPAAKPAVAAAAVAGAAVVHAGAAAPAAAATAAATTTAATGSDVDPQDSEALSRKVQSLEKELSDVKGQIDSDQDKIAVLTEQTERADEPARSTATAQAPRKTLQQPVVPIVAGVGLLAAALTGFFVRGRRRARILNESQPEIPAYRDGVVPVRTTEAPAVDTGMTVELSVYEAPEPQQTATESAVSDAQAHTAQSDTAQADSALADTHLLPAHVDTQPEQSYPPARAHFAPSGDTQEFPLHGPAEATQPLLPIVAPAAAKRANQAAATISRPEPEETTINLRLDGTRIESTRAEPSRLDYNLLDLDMTAAQHVHLPSELHEPVVKERRKNLAEVLKLAIEREPDRHDLRMKLLEFYYSAATTNRQGFLEVVQRFAHDRELLEPGVWDRIAFMGRQIASENPLFAETTAADDDLADCA
jgi:pilus assembly protein FimV